MHELGHALGMAHDFEEEDKYGRGISNLEAGCDHQGWMSYRPHPKEWSSCSLEDFKSHYNLMVEKNGEWCLGPAPDACS